MRIHSVPRRNNTQCPSLKGGSVVTGRPCLARVKKSAAQMRGPS
ncbi:hypothetical protein ABZ478_33980 [Streptomyces sp. NPDC005706]